MVSRWRGRSSILVAVLVAAMTCLVAGPAPAGAAAPDRTRPAAAGAGLVGRLVQAMTLDEKLGMVNGWPDGVTPPPTTDRLIGVGFIPGVPAARRPGVDVHRRPGRRPDEPADHGDARAGGAGRDVQRRPGPALRPGPRPRLPGPGPGRDLRADAQPGAGTAGRPELRDARRGPVPDEPAGHGRDQGHPGRGRDRHREALRREQPGEPAADDQRQRRRADAARDGAARLRSRGATGPRRLGHVLVQLGQREVRLREPHPAHRHPAPPVGLPRLRRLRLRGQPQRRPGAAGRVGHRVLRHPLP